MNAENVDIQISLKSIWWRDPPYCEIYIDDRVIDRLHVTNKEGEDLHSRDVYFRNDLSYGDHRLVIRYLNKKDDDDHYDSEGYVIKSQSLLVKQVIINRFNVCLDHNVTFNSKPYASELIFENGDWVLNFSVPTYLWLMENT